MTAEPTPLRPSCGTLRGFRMHVTNAEAPCDWCTHAGLVARLEVERHAPGPRRQLSDPEPITPERAAVNRARLAKAVGDYTTYEKASA